MNHSINVLIDRWSSKYIYIEVATESNSYEPLSSIDKISNISFEKKNYNMKISNEGPYYESILLEFYNSTFGSDTYPFQSGYRGEGHGGSLYIAIGVLCGIFALYCFGYCCFGCEKKK